MFGIIYVVIGLSLFIVGLREALFPLGEIMARQLTAPEFIAAGDAAALTWRSYGWVYAFAAAIGFATTIAEPSLIAVALKARQVSGGAISIWGLRLAVAVGVAMGVGLGAFRIVTGTPLVFYIMAAYVAVIALTLRSGRTIIPLALRFRRRDHIDRNGAAGYGARARSRHDHSRPQPRSSTASVS